MERWQLAVTCGVWSGASRYPRPGPTALPLLLVGQHGLRDRELVGTVGPCDVLGDAGHDVWRVLHCTGRRPRVGVLGRGQSYGTSAFLLATSGRVPSTVVLSHTLHSP